MTHKSASDDPLTTVSEETSSSAGDFSIVGAVDPTGDPHPAVEAAAPWQDFSSATEPQPGYVGEFRIIRQVGRGGMGVVYEAEQMSLGRRVALKILPMASVLDGRQLVRFKNEARAAATLVHPHIVPVFSIGCERGVHYYAMQFIEGRSLAEVIASLRSDAGLDRRKSPASSSTQGSPAAGNLAKANPAAGIPVPRIPEAELPAAESEATESRVAEVGAAEVGADRSGRPLGRRGTATSPAVTSKSGENAARASGSTESSGLRRRRYEMAARWGAAVADALEHAHSLGVVHRDIKPANLMLDQEGKVWVTDFGLAQLEADAGMTMTGDVLGTVRYMSPEQAQGKRGMVDGHSDVYSLGISLYELITLRPAFPGTERARVLRQVVEVEPPSLRSVDPHVPRDLETVVMKAIAKEPQGRYASAKEFADDLRRFVADEPIRAKRPTLMDRGAKWARRHRALVGVAIGLWVILCAMLIVGLSLIEQQRARAVANERIAQQSAARELRLRHRAEELREQAERHGKHVERLLYMADLKLAALAWEKGDLQQYVNLLSTHRPARGAESSRGFEWNYLWRRGVLEHREFAPQEEAVHAASFSPDGHTIAIGCGDGDTILFDAAAELPPGGKPEPPRVLMPPARQRITSVAFAPDGGRLAVACYDGTIRVRDLGAGHASWKKIVQTEGEATGVVFTRDGKLLISCGLEPVVRLWDPTDGRPRGELQSQTPGLPGHRQVIHALDVSADGQLLAAAGGPDNHTLMIWDLATQTEKHLLRGHQGRLTSVSFSPDGRFVATGSVDKTVRLWDLTREREIFIGEHLDSIRSVAFSPEGRWLATGDWNGSVRLWPIESLATATALPNRSAHPSRVWQAHTGRVYALDFSPTGERLVSAGRDGKIKLWNLASQPRQTLAVPPGGKTTRGGTFTADSRYFIRAQEESIALWNLETDALDEIIAVQSQPRASMAVSRVDGRLFIGGGPGTVEVWDLLRRKRVARWPVGDSESEIHPHDVSPDGSTLAATDWIDDTLWLFDTASGKATGLPAKQCHDAVFLRDGAEVAVDTLDKIVIWNLAERREVRRLRGHNNTIEALAVSPDGRRLASCGQDRQVKIWDLQTCRELHILSSHRDEVTAVTFSPDGRSLVSGDRSGALLVWEVESGRLVCELEQFTAEISDVEFSPDGLTLACHLADAPEAAVLLDVSPPASWIK